jgi:predicted dehydrogenase
MAHKKLKMGMIGGGRGSFIGAVHHMAAVLDNQIELVCGAFSSKESVSLESGKDYFLTENRIYPNYTEMFIKEKSLPEHERMDFVAIVTPNNVHFEPAKLALENGFHVICDKPLSFNLDEAYKIKQMVEQTGLTFAVTHAYTGYPMVKEAREMVRQNAFGKIRKIMVEYPQGWLAERVEAGDNRQASWRTDPKRSGISCTMGDIGVHAFNLTEYITGLHVNELCSDINSFVEGRELDDDGSALLRFNNGARGILTASQICAGVENDLKIQVYGEKGGFEWRQMEPNTLKVLWTDKPMEIRRTGIMPFSDVSANHMRVPPGHPEGYIEAFANIYRNFAMAINNLNNGKTPEPGYDFPGIDEGVRGMEFIYKVIESGQSKTKWLEL